MCKGMLGNLPLSDIQGPLNELQQRLAGQEGEKWLRDFKKFLRKEDQPPYMVSALQNLNGFAETWRVTQALLRYNLGYGKASGFTSFEEYLKTIPKIPAAVLEDGSFPPIVIILVDKRPGIPKCCELAGLSLLPERSFLPRNIEDTVPASTYWIAVNLGLDPSQRRKSPLLVEIGLDEGEGISVYTQCPEVLRVGTFVLAGTRCAQKRDHMGCITLNGRDPILGICDEDDVSKCTHIPTRRAFKSTN